MTEPVFRPRKPPKPKKRAIMIQLEQDHYVRVAQAAEQHGVPIKTFLRQALDFAMQHMEQPEG